MAKSNQKSNNNNNRKKKSNGRGTSVASSSAPAAVSYRGRTGRADIRQMNDSVVIRHREFLYDFNGSTDFAWDQLPLQPASTTFPWLKKVATQYEQYQFNKLEFHYMPACSTSTQGTVSLIIDYDPVDAGPDTKTQGLAYSGVVYGGAWTQLKHVSQKHNLVKHTRLYTRPASQPVSTDLKTYDVGNLFLATDGFVNDSTLAGSLWVEYEIRLYTPQIVPEAECGYVSSTPSGDNNKPFGTTGILQNGYMEASVVDGHLEFVKPFEGLVYLLQNIGASDAYGPLVLDTANTTCKAASVLGSTKKLAGDVGARLISHVFRVIADTGQKLYATNSTGATPTSQNIRYATAVYNEL